MAAGGAALTVFPLSATEPSAECAAERDVAAFVSRYGRCSKIFRPSNRSTELEVHLHSLERFTRVFGSEKLPFERIHVGPDGAMKFNHRGIDFTVVNVV
jgi:hypothetical protein